MAVGYLIFNLLVQGVLMALRPFTGSWHALQDRFRGSGTSDWPTATGTIFMCQVSQGENIWTALITYAYSAQGEYWSGEMRRHFAAGHDVDDYAAAHPKGSALVVRYNPTQPGKSVVLADDQRLASAAGTI